MITTQDDDTTLEQAATGEPAAVRECLERFGPMVWAMARQAFGGSPAAEDAVQDVFIDLWKHAGRFDRNIARSRAFVSTIAKRRIIDRYRSERSGVKGTALDSAPEIAWSQPVASALTAEDDQRIKAAAAAIEGLPEDQQTAIKLHIYNGLAHQAIADRLNMPLGTVKSHLRRGLLKIRQLVGVLPAEVQP